MGIEDILMDDESLFSNINAFDPDYMPPNYNFRDVQMEAMAMAIRPAISGGKPLNSIVLGPCATGKTTAIRKIFELVEKSTEKIVCVYINCQLHTTRFGVFSQIYKKIFGFLPPSTGVPLSKVYGEIMQHLLKEKKVLIVALDDVNYLFQHNHANKVFYDLLRAYEEYSGVKIGIFSIMTDLESKFVLDKNVNSVFIPQEITFQPYTYSEIENILRDRVNAGFFANVMSNDILEQISQYTYENGDLRTGINLLKLAGNIAETHASKKITQGDLDKAIKSLVPFNLVETIKSLSDNEKSLLKVIIENEETLTAKELFELYAEQTNLSYSTFIRALDKLEFLRLVDSEYKGEGTVGNSRNIIFRFNSKEIKKKDIL